MHHVMHLMAKVRQGCGGRQPSSLVLAARTGVTQLQRQVMSTIWEDAGFHHASWFRAPQFGSVWLGSAKTIEHRG
jgi:hypothetical protein